MQKINIKYKFKFEWFDVGFCRVMYSTIINDKKIYFCFMEGQFFQCTDDYHEPISPITFKVPVSFDIPYPSKNYKGYEQELSKMACFVIRKSNNAYFVNDKKVS